MDILDAMILAPDNNVDALDPPSKILLQRLERNQVIPVDQHVFAAGITVGFMTAQEAQEAVENLEIGGRNYILNSDSEISDSAALIARYVLSEAMIPGEEYTISLTLTPGETYAGLTVRTSDGNTILATIDLSGAARQTVNASFTAEYASGKSPEDDPEYGDILIYRQPASAGTASTIIHQIKLEKGNRATDWTAAPEDAEEVLEQKLSSVRAQISTEADSIRSEVQATYALASDMTQVTQQVGTLSEQTESNYTWAVTRINQMQQDMEAAQEATDEQLAIFRTYMSFDDNGLVIGKTGNPFTFRVVNDRLAFYMNDTDVSIHDAHESFSVILEHRATEVHIEFSPLVDASGHAFILICLGLSESIGRLSGQIHEKKTTAPPIVVCIFGNSSGSANLMICFGFRWVIAFDCTILYLQLVRKAEELM